MSILSNKLWSRRRKRTSISDFIVKMDSLSPSQLILKSSVNTSSRCSVILINMDFNMDVNTQFIFPVSAKTLSLTLPI